MANSTIIFMQSLLFQLTIQAVPILLLALFVLSKIKKLHAEKIALEKERAKQLDALNERLQKIEKLLQK